MQQRVSSLRANVRQRFAPRAYDAEGADYAQMTDAPDGVIGPDGGYRPGWFASAPDALNLEANAQAGWRRLHRWFFIHFDSADYFVGANLIDLRLGGNVGLVVLDKRTGDFTTKSATGLLLNNGITISSDGRCFSDLKTSSTIRISSDDTALDFRIAVDGLVFEGRARALFDRPFVQSTRLSEHLGALQLWGNLMLEEATLTLPGRAPVKMADLYGCYDRSMGHRRLVENWNWIAACGPATAPDGESVDFALHAALDRPGARPQVDGQKYALWLGDHFVKLPELQFDYDYVDAKALSTTAWRIHSPADHRVWIDLTFTPGHHRRDAHAIPLLFEVDHSQYFGALSGTVSVDGVAYRVDGVFATTEDSMMVV